MEIPAGAIKAIKVLKLSDECLYCDSSTVFQVTKVTVVFVLKSGVMFY